MIAPARPHRPVRTVAALLAAGINMMCSNAALGPAEWQQTADLIAFSGAAVTARCTPPRFAPLSVSRACMRPGAGALVSRAERPPRTATNDATGVAPDPARRAAAPVMTAPSAAGGRNDPADDREAPRTWSWNQGVDSFQRQHTGPSPDVPPLAFLPFPRYGATPAPYRSDARGARETADGPPSDTTPTSLALALESGCGSDGCGTSPH